MNRHHHAETSIFPFDLGDAGFRSAPTTSRWLILPSTQATGVVGIHPVHPVEEEFVPPHERVARGVVGKADHLPAQSAQDFGSRMHDDWVFEAPNDKPGTYRRKW